MASPLRVVAQGLDPYRSGEINEAACLAELLFAMTQRSSWAAWFAARERFLRSEYKSLGIDPANIEETRAK
jgi:hypothetical protein